VVGQITQVSHTASRVLVLTDSNSGIDAVVQRSRARGIVQGGVDAGCSMKYLRRAEDVSVGDRIVTSGLDNIFPKGILIGTAVAVELRDRGLLQAAVIQPSAPLDQLEEVLIVDPRAQIQEGEL
jgi:rod shape-determining protein MreC